MQKKLITVAFLIIMALGLGLILAIFSAKIPPEDLTRSHMISISVRIREYLKTHKKLPDDLSQLPKREGYGNSTKDGWGNEIKYHIVNDETVKLTSFGKDGKPGGKGRSSDITGSFYPRLENDFPFIHASASPNLTYCRMFSIQQCLTEYVKIHKGLPSDLSWLTKQKGLDNITTDDWGNEIKYIVADNKIVNLISFGKDGKLGGEKENKDIKWSFKLE